MIDHEREVWARQDHFLESDIDRLLDRKLGTSVIFDRRTKGQYGLEPASAR